MNPTWLVQPMDSKHRAAGNPVIVRSRTPEGARRFARQWRRVTGQPRPAYFAVQVYHPERDPALRPYLRAGSPGQVAAPPMVASAAAAPGAGLAAVVRAASREDEGRWVVVTGPGTNDQAVVGSYRTMLGAARARAEWGADADIMLRLDNGDLTTEF